jgi:ATP-binding cassette subfamily F protein 3
MILLRNLSFGRGSRMLAERASLQLHPGWKIGLTGANGSGKSSFFALLRGEMQPEAGDLEIPSVWAIAHVAQDTPALPDEALEFVLDGDTELRQIERDLAEAEEPARWGPRRRTFGTCMRATARSTVTRPRHAPPS